MINIFMLVLLQSAQADFVRGNTSLLKEPTHTSEVIQILPPKTEVKVSQKKGIWVMVQTSHPHTGWLKSYQITKSISNNTHQSGENNFHVDSPRVTGVKGLTEEDIKRITPNSSLAESLDDFQSNKNLALEFAHSLELKNTKINYSKMDQE